MDWNNLIAVFVAITIAEIIYRALFYPKLLKQAQAELVKKLGEMVEANDEVTITIVRQDKKAKG